MPTAAIIRKLLIDLGIGTAAGSWPVFIAFLPDFPDNAIIVYDTAGILDGRIMATGEQIEHPGFQIRIRGPEYPVVLSKVSDIALGIDSQRKVSVALSVSEAYTVHNISRTGAPIPLGLEEIGDRKNFHFTVNGVATIERTL